MAEDPLERLLRGNERFVAQRALYPNQSPERREQVVPAQVPFAVILGCSDSRVPLEIVFDQGIGDLYVVRVAGNVLDDMVLGSIEFAIEQFQPPLLMALGHAKCGAATATVRAVQENTVVTGKIASIVDAIRPVVEQVKEQPGDLVDNVVRANVLHVVEQLRRADPFIKPYLTENKLKIVGAYYALDTGKVEILN